MCVVPVCQLWGDVDCETVEKKGLQTRGRNSEMAAFNINRLSATQQCHAARFYSVAAILKHSSQVITQTSAVPVQNMLVLLFAVFFKTAHLNIFPFDTALPWVLRNTPTKCEVDWMNGC